MIKLNISPIEIVSHTPSISKNCGSTSTGITIKRIVRQKDSIVAGPCEDKEELARISSRLLVANPAVAFAHSTTNHELDQLSDCEYDRLLAVVSRLSLLFVDPKTGKSAHYLDIFNLTVRLLNEYMLHFLSPNAKMRSGNFRVFFLERIKKCKQQIE